MYRDRASRVRTQPNQAMQPTPKGLKLARCPHSLIASLATLPSMSLIPFAPFASGLAPIGSNLSLFATTPWILSRCPASLVPFASSRSRTSAVMLFNASRGLSLSR